MDTNASDIAAPAKTDPTKGHSAGPFFVTKDTVITTDRDEDGDPDCDTDKRAWIGEFYGSERAAADAAFACRAMNSHDDLVTALALLLDQVDYKAGNCGITEMVGAVLPADVIAYARIALKLARGDA